MIRAIVGANWGDEGKGKITDLLAKDSDVVIRFQGGANAGHTIINEYGKFALHMLPSGVFYPHTVNILGPGVALDMEKLLAEYHHIVERGVPKPILYVSDRAQVVLPYHIALDSYEEERLGDAGFGSTKSGIAPFYGDKYLKAGIQVCQLYDEDFLLSRLAQALEPKNVLFEHLYDKPTVAAKDLALLLLEWGRQIRPMVIDTAVFIRKAIEEGKSILLEGQLGSLRDPDHGIYPFTTSSSPLAAHGAASIGVSPRYIQDVCAVTKAYSSCVGAGPFVTELFEDEAQELRRRGGDTGEYGATTGRPRRVGWFDAVATRYGCLVQGATEVALTNLDVLGYLPEIPVCIGYDAADGIIKDFPSTPTLMGVKPVYKVLPGWERDIRGETEYAHLPDNCKRYADYIEQQLDIPIRLISTGPKRHDVILRR